MKAPNFKIKLLCTVLAIIMISLTLVSCNKSESYDNGTSIGDAESGSNISSPNAGGSTKVESERKIIKTVKISAETKDFENTIKNINDKCDNLGGYIESSTVQGNHLDDRKGARSATYTLRIPHDKLDAFTGDIEKSVNVTNITSNIDEITDAYYDAVARLSVLESQKESLQKMYDSFTSYSDINDMMIVQDKLYDVIEEIESYKARINAYDNKVEYSTVNLTIFEVVEYTEKDEEEKGFGQRMGDSFVEGITDFWKGCQDFIVWFVGAIPSLITWALIIFAIVKISRKIRKKKREKKEKNNNSPTDNQTQG